MKELFEELKSGKQEIITRKYDNYDKLMVEEGFCSIDFRDDEMREYCAKDKIVGWLNGKAVKLTHSV